VPALTCYALNNEVDGQPIHQQRDFIDDEDRRITSYGPVSGRQFEAELFVSSVPPHEPRWADFLRSGFGSNVDILRSASVGAVIVVRIGSGGSRQYFALTFGISGRHLLKDGAWQRAYGLRTALNLIYPSGGVSDEELSRLVALDAKRRGGETLRSRRQSSRATTFEGFDLDRLRDVVDAATGRPSNAQVWGPRISGGDALHFSTEISFDELGALCQQIAAAHARDDYRERFGWLDNIQPVTDPELREALEEAVREALVNERLEELDLAPPEIVDWTRVVSFRFHFDGRRRLVRPDMRLQDYVVGLRQEGVLADVDVAYLKRRRISALDADDEPVHRWSVWRCLTGELQIEGHTYVLDEGEFFVIATDYLSEVNQFVERLPDSSVTLPAAGSRMREKDYNESAAEALDAVLLDRATISTSAATTPIEICDLLTRDKQLIHVKRHLGSRDLSHLFAQGFVSAELLQEDEQFRVAAQQKVIELTDSMREEIFGREGIVTSDFEVVYAIIAEWRDRRLEEALPFFSKVNLRRTVQSLSSRGFGVSCVRVPVEA
jgi:uncharacterized protein (TIGR04141 family)